MWTKQIVSQALGKNSVSPSRSEYGFTIVELLVVIVTIAILASIAVASYQGIQGRAHDVAIQNDLRNIRTSLEIYHAKKGVYPGRGEAGGASVDIILEELSNSDTPIKFTVGSYSKFFNEVRDGHFLIGYTQDNLGAGISRIAAICMMFPSKSGNAFLFSSENGTTNLGKIPWPPSNSFDGVEPNSLKYYCQENGDVENASSLTYGGRYVDDY